MMANYKYWHFVVSFINDFYCSGVLYLLLFTICLATCFRTMITPVFSCVLSKVLAMNHDLLTYLEKSIT